MSKSVAQKAIQFVLLVLVIVLGPWAFAQTDWTVTKTFQVGGEGGWDYITVDPDTHRLYVTRSTHTMVIDA